VPAAAEIRGGARRRGRDRGLPNTTIRFDEFMRIALYGEHGFYAGSDDGVRGGHAGRRGDFLTAPEVGPLFGAVLARALDHRWVELGRPDPFTVVDVGAGPGTLARGIVAAGPQCETRSGTSRWRCPSRSARAIRRSSRA
jgi:SAM-dependent MidA family methyltransferase